MDEAAYLFNRGNTSNRAEQQLEAQKKHNNIVSNTYNIFSTEEARREELNVRRAQKDKDLLAKSNTKWWQ
jgi:hypothetical protein